MDKKLKSLVKLKLKNTNLTNIPVSVNDVDINKIVVPNEVSVGKKVLTILLVTKMVRQLDSLMVRQ